LQRQHAEGEGCPGNNRYASMFSINVVVRSNELGQLALLLTFSSFLPVSGCFVVFTVSGCVPLLSLARAAGVPMPSACTSRSRLGIMPFAVPLRRRERVNVVLADL
jgi:hypothetical protein